MMTSEELIAELLRLERERQEQITTITEAFVKLRHVCERQAKVTDQCIATLQRNDDPADYWKRGENPDA